MLPIHYEYGFTKVLSSMFDVDRSLLLEPSMFQCYTLEAQKYKLNTYAFILSRVPSFLSRVPGTVLALKNRLRHLLYMNYFSVPFLTEVFY